MTSDSRLAFAAVAIAAAVVGAACRDTVASNEPPAPAALSVRTAAAEPRDILETLTLSGTLRPRAQVDVVAEVGARLLHVLKVEGARVDSGEPLAQLDGTDLHLTHARVQALLAAAEANHSHAIAEKERADSLRRTGGITEQGRLAAEVGLQLAAAALDQARAEEALAAKQEERTVVRAPFAGVVAHSMVDAGTMVAPGTPLFTLVDDAQLELRGALPSLDFGQATVGDAATVTVDALAGVELQGKVARITPLVDERTRTFEIVVVVDGREGLAGGSFARATIELGTVEGALMVPPGALLRDEADPRSAAAFVVVDGHAERRALGLGLERPEGVQVTAGLAAGERVVLEPPAALTGGDAVVDVDARAAAERS